MAAAPASKTSAGSILELVRSGKARTRRDVQDLTGLSRSTLSLRMSQLLEAGYVRESGQLSGSAGRPARLLSFNEEQQVILAVDLGATHAHLAVLDGSGQVLVEVTSAQRIDTGPDEILRYVTRRLGELLDRSGRTLSDVAGVGVGIPGPVRFDAQTPNHPPLMPGWDGYPVARRISETLKVPTFIDNDANLMGLGEARTFYSDTDSLLFVKVGTGIGAGVILRGAPERGTAGGAGDIGHVRIVTTPDARKCTCGAYGCLATEASGSAIVRALNESGRNVSSPAEVARLVLDDDPQATALVTRAGQLLGDVLATSVALLNPSVLVLGGSLGASGPQFANAVRERVFERTVPLATRELIITTSNLGSSAAIHGARHMVIDQTFSADAVDQRLAATYTVAQA